MENKNHGTFLNVEVLGVICGILQIVGLFLIIFKTAPVLISVCGFAAVVRIFLPLESSKSFISYAGAVARLLIIVIYTITGGSHLPR